MVWAPPAGSNKLQRAFLRDGNMVHKDVRSLPVPRLQSLGGVQRCLSSEKQPLVKKLCILFCSVLLQVRGGPEPRRPSGSALYREWGIEEACVTRPPAAPSLAPLWPWRGSGRSTAAGWSWSWSPGDWGGCGWSSRDGPPGRRRWAPPPRGPHRRSEGRSHRGTRLGCRRRCSRAMDIPNVLQTKGVIMEGQSRDCLSRCHVLMDPDISVIRSQIVMDSHTHSLS